MLQPVLSFSPQTFHQDSGQHMQEELRFLQQLLSSNANSQSHLVFAQPHTHSWHRNMAEHRIIIVCSHWSCKGFQSRRCPLKQRGSREASMRYCSNLCWRELSCYPLSPHSIDKMWRGCKRGINNIFQVRIRGYLRFGFHRGQTSGWNSTPVPQSLWEWGRSAAECSLFTV